MASVYGNVRRDSGGSVVLCGAALMLIVNVAAIKQITGHAGRNWTLTTMILLIGCTMLSFGIRNRIAEGRVRKSIGENLRRLAEAANAYESRVREMPNSSSTTSREQTKVNNKPFPRSCGLRFSNL